MDEGFKEIIKVNCIPSFDSQEFDSYRPVTVIMKTVGGGRKNLEANLFELDLVERIGIVTESGVMG